MGSPMALTLLLLALALAADATAVSITAGIAAKRVRLRDALFLGGSFGVAQGLMPVLGWAVGRRFSSEIEAWDHWLVLVLLGGIGAKMIVDGVRAWRAKDDPSKDAPTNPFAPRNVLLMSVATSIDALAAGVTLPLLDVHIVIAAIVIAAVTFVLCVLGALLGRRLGVRLGPRLDIAGGLILIGLGIKTVIDHVTAQGS
jgi:putative Mn2+ efflux pump MntP